MSLVFAMGSLCALVFGAALAQLGLVTPLCGLGISLAALPLSLFAITGSLARVGKTRSWLPFLATFAAWPAPVLLGPPTVRLLAAEFSGRRSEPPTVTTTLEPEQILAVATQIVRSHADWRVVRSDRKQGELEILALSDIFQFRNAFLLRAGRDQGNTRVSIEGRSPRGRFDVGGLDRVMSDFMRDLATALRRGPTLPDSPESREAKDRRHIRL